MHDPDRDPGELIVSEPPIRLVRVHPGLYLDPDRVTYLRATDVEGEDRNGVEIGYGNRTFIVHCGDEWVRNVDEVANALGFLAPEMAAFLKVSPFLPPEGP